MSLLVWIIVGAIAGWLASLVTGSKLGLIKGIFVGMIGSIVGGFLLVLLQTGTLDFTLAFTSFNIASILVSAIGAAVFIALMRIF